MLENKSLEDMTILELETYIQNKKEEETRINYKKIQNTKPKMKTGKKAMWVGMFFCIILVMFSMAMIMIDKDTNTTSILGGAGVAAIPFLFGIYEKYSTEISLKNMEENFIEDYDKKMGIY